MAWRGAAARHRHLDAPLDGVKAVRGAQLPRPQLLQQRWRLGSPDLGEAQHHLLVRALRVQISRALLRGRVQLQC